jgi:hypothetical protein
MHIMFKPGVLSRSRFGGVSIQRESFLYTNKKIDGYINIWIYGDIDIWIYGYMVV